jgi:hypothetical protein
VLVSGNYSTVVRPATASRSTDKIKTNTATTVPTQHYLYNMHLVSFITSDNITQLTDVLFGH